MKVYHGGEQAVPHPAADFAAAGRSTDFGTGFYATTSLDQARNWVRYKLGHSLYASGFVSEFEIPDNIMALPALKTLSFQGANSAWLRFVVNNRQNPDFDHGYDLVYGPVANDKVFATIALFEDGIIDEEMTISRLRPMKLVDQYLFHTQQAVDCLRYLGCEEIRCPR